MLFDWLVTGQIVATNPAHAVRGPKHVVKTGKTTDAWRMVQRRAVASTRLCCFRGETSSISFACLAFS
jgi:hypothetical protein